MSGLLLKDFYILKKDCYWNVIIALGFSLFGIFTSNPFWVVWPVLMCGLMPGTIMGLEEQSGWMAYADTMPWSRKTVVTAKYAFLLLLVFGTSTLLAVIFTLSGALAKMDLTIFDLLAISLIIGVVPSCIMLPVNFKVGTVKGRIWYFAAIAVAAGIGGGASALLIDSAAKLPENTGSFYWLLFVLPIVILVISWCLSVKFYEKREL